MKKESVVSKYFNILSFNYFIFFTIYPLSESKDNLPTTNTSPSFRHILIDRAIPSFGNDHDFLIELISFSYK